MERQQFRGGLRKAQASTNEFLKFARRISSSAPFKQTERRAELPHGSGLTKPSFQSCQLASEVYMKSIYIAKTVTAVVFALAATATFAQAVIVAPPPPPRAEVVPGPRPGWVWDPGHWAWRGGQYAWIPGHWQAVRPGYRWIPGHWVQRGPNWRWVPGHWA
jgi:hypothetical protein